MPDLIKTFFDDPTLLSIPNIPTIRNIYIPELVFALHRLYVDAGRLINKTLLTETLELATVVADPRYSVLLTFENTGRLEEYVKEVAAGSRGILGANQTGKGGKALGIWGVGK